MLKSIFGKSIWERRKSTIIWSAAMFLMSVLMVSMFESIGVNYDELFSEGVPPAFEAFVGEVSSFGSPEGWLGAEMYSMTYPVALAIIALGFGAAAIGKEEDAGTLELLLASPIKRSRIFMQKVMAMVCVTGLVAFATFVGIVAGMVFFDFSISIGNVIFVTLAGWVLSLWFGGLALTLQSIFSRRGVALSISIGIFIAMYLGYTFSVIVDWLKYVKYGSPFYYYNANETLESGPNILLFGILIVTTFGLFLYASYLFSKRDTSV